ncbi:MAG: hypothetical protein SPF87_01845 [Bacilli bacterium]|nr:hypothetical protein [Bacilli bacterium]
MKIKKRINEIKIEYAFKDQNYFYLEKSKRNHFTIIDLFKFAIRHIIELVVGFVFGLAISFGLADIVTPQTYSATSYLSVNQTVNFVVYQAASDLLTSDDVISNTANTINKTQTFVGHEQVTASMIKKGLVIDVYDQRMRIPVKFTATNKDSIVPILNVLFDVYSDVVSSHPSDYKDLNNYVFVQERATNAVADLSKKPIVFVCGVTSFFSIALVVSIFIEKKRKDYFSINQLQNLEFDVFAFKDKGIDCVKETLCNYCRKNDSECKIILMSSYFDTLLNGEVDNYLIPIESLFVTLNNNVKTIFLVGNLKDFKKECLKKINSLSKMHNVSFKLMVKI